MKADQLDSLETPDVVDVLVAEYLDALDHGKAPSRSDWLERHPEHAAELARFLDDLQRLSPAASSVRADETQMIADGVSPNPRPARDAETVLWNSTSAPTNVFRHDAAELPFNGLFGDYDLLETIARGGMGVVFKARHRQLKRIVALKMILAGQLADAHHIQRFRAEAQAAAKLDHPGIVAVYEVGEQQGLQYFTMAFVEGKSLAERLRDGPLPAKDAARLVRDLAAAIAYAHEHGIVHRDLKPANVLIDAQGQPKLTDFGLAKQTQGASEMTGTGQILGTPSYMSPEQAQGDTATIGPAADVYGLGALLFALVTGRPPFQGASAVETIQHVIAAEPPRPRSLNPSVPRDLETICLKCLEKSPAKRYVSAIALKEDLDRFLDDRPILARPVGIIEKSYRWYRRRPVIGTMAATLVVLLIAVPVLLGFFLVEAEARAELEADGHVKEKARAKLEADGHAKEKDAREKVEQAHEKTKAAERERTRQLFQAFVNEASARRTSPRHGRHFDSLDRIVAARELADELKLPIENYTRLRSEAISALSLVDLQATSKGPGWLSSTTPEICQFADSKDSYLAWDEPNGVLVRRLADNRILQRIPVEKTGWHHIQVWLSPDNRFVLGHANGKITVWQVDGAKPVAIRHLEGGATSLALFAPDRPEVFHYTAKDEMVIVPLEGKDEPITVRFPEAVKKSRAPYWQWLFRPGPRRQVAFAGVNRIYLVDLDAGNVTASFAVPGQEADMAWSRDGATVAVACSDKGVVFFHPASKSERVVKTTIGGPEKIAFDPSGRFLIVRNWWTGQTMLLNVNLGTPELRFDIRELSDDDTASRGELGHWWWCRGALDTPHRILPVQPEDGLASDIAIHPGGRLLATTTNLGIVLSDLVTCQRLQVLPQANGRWPRFDADGNLYAPGSLPGGGQFAYRWPISHKDNRYQVGAAERLLTFGPYGFDISADGRMLAASTFQRAFALDRQTGKMVASDPYPGARHMAISPDGLSAVSFGWDGGSDGFRVWETKTGKLVHVHRTGIHGQGRFTPDGKHLVSHASVEKELLGWSVADWKMVRKLGAPGLFAISPDSRYLAVAEHNGKARLTRIADGALVARFDAPGEEYLNAMAFSPDGRFLVATTIERTKHHIWDLWKLRRQLRELKLDWEKDAPPQAPAVVEPIVVELLQQKKS